MQTPVVPGAQGSQQPWLQETWCYKYSFLASVGSAPVRTECGAVACIAGTRQHQVCREGSNHRCRRYGPIRILFCPLAADTQRAFLAGPSLLLDIGGTQGHPWPGAFSTALQVRRSKGRPPWGLSLLVSCLRRLWRVFLYWSAACAACGGSFSIGQLPAPLWRGRPQSWLHPLLWLSSGALPPWLPSVPSEAFRAGFLPPVPLGHHLPSVNSSAGPGTALHSHAPAPSRRAFGWTCVLVRGM